jgi:hypothetical protein
MSHEIYNVTFSAPAPRSELRSTIARSQRTTGTTTLRTPFVDRAPLRGPLDRIDAHGLDLLEVKLVHEASRDDHRTAGQLGDVARYSRENASTNS